MSHHVPLGERIIGHDLIIRHTERTQDQGAGKARPILAGKAVDHNGGNITSQVAEERAEAFANIAEQQEIVLHHGVCDGKIVHDNRDIEVLETGGNERAFGIIADFISRTKIDHCPDAKRTQRDRIARCQSIEDIAAKYAATPNGSPIGGRQTAQIPEVHHPFQPKDSRFIDRHAVSTTFHVLQ